MSTINATFLSRISDPEVTHHDVIKLVIIVVIVFVFIVIVIWLRQIIIILEILQKSRRAARLQEVVVALTETNNVTHCSSSDAQHVSRKSSSLSVKPMTSHTHV